ncbi:MAG: HAD-IA family hydrolase [Gammaproteobacteria bacterium]|nr:HAD-IA family hydrolase [Gammaproteobacteria bacterium]
MSLIIFDCDGVLVDSEAIMLREELIFLAAAGLEVSREQYLSRFMGLPLEVWRSTVRSDMIKAGRPSPDDDAFDALDDHIANCLDSELTTVDGCKAAIEALEAEVCVASSSSIDSLETKLRKTELWSLFAPHVFSTQLVKRGKPYPDLFLYAAQELRAKPAECIVVEDSVNGVRAAKAAGMLTIGFTAGTHCSDDHGGALETGGADQVVGSYGELLSALKALT